MAGQMSADAFQAPALRKAVVDCTQAHDVVVPCETQQLLKGYLADKKTVDAVYAMLLRRAMVNQSSAAVVEKCVALIKQYVERYPPSIGTLQATRELCTTVLQRHQLSPGGRRAAEYLLRKLRPLLPPAAESPWAPASDGSQAAAALSSPMRHSTADELLFATAHLDTQAQASAAPPSSTAHMLHPRATLQRAPVLKLTTALHGYLHGHSAAEQGGGGTLSSRDIISSIMEGSEAVVAEQVRDIVAATMTRQTASWPGQAPGAAAPAVGARLYSPPVYSGGEQLMLDEAEVAGVVALVCGPGAGDEGGAAVPLPRSWGQEDSLWRPAAIGQPSLGQMCSSVLVKLLLDLWMHAPPQAASLLAARLLATCQASGRPDLRCRAHDLLYNLSLHSALLADLHHPDLHVQGVQQLEALERWLRGLLYSAVHNMLQAREGSEEVWRSALGVLLQLVAHCGHLVAPLAADVPPAVAAAFLDRCQQYGWSEELYCHLVELAAASLLAAARVLPPGGAQERQGAPPAVLDEWEVAALVGGGMEDALRAFGGLPHLLHHFCNCPTPASRGHLLRVMLHAALPAGTAAGQMGHVAALLLAPMAAEALQTALRLPVPGLAAHLQSCLMRAATAAAAASVDSGSDPTADIDAALLLRVLGVFEAAALSTTGCPEATAVEAALHPLPPGATDPLVAWQLLRDVRGPALAHPVARRVVVLRLYRLIDTAIAQHQVSSLPQLAAVGLLPQPPSASAVLQGAAVPQSLLADLLLAGGPPGAIAAFLLVQRLLAALRHRVLTAARGRDAAATTLRWHLAAACAATWRSLVQWLQQAPGGLPRPLQRAIAGEVLRLPVTLLPPKAQPAAAWTPGCEEELPLSALLVAGRAALSEKALQLLGPLLVQVLQLLPPGPPHLQQLHRGCYIRLRPPPLGLPTRAQPGDATSARRSQQEGSAGPGGGGAGVLWAPWSETEAEQRLALVVLLVGHWQLAPAEVAGAAAQVVVRRWLEDGDPRVRYVGGRCVQLQLLATQPEQYWSSLRVLVLQAQRLVQRQLLDNPLLQISALHEMKLV